MAFHKLWFSTVSLCFLKQRHERYVRQKNTASDGSQEKKARYFMEEVQEVNLLDFGQGEGEDDPILKVVGHF